MIVTKSGTLYIMFQVIMVKIIGFIYQIPLNVVFEINISVSALLFKYHVIFFQLDIR